MNYGLTAFFILIIIVSAINNKKKYGTFSNYLKTRKYNLIVSAFFISLSIIITAYFYSHY